MDRIQAFLDDLKALTEKHGIKIVDKSCGCCGHTHLVDTVTKEKLLDTGDWDDTRLEGAL